MPKKRPILLTVALALTVAVTVSVTLHINCETTVIVGCDAECHRVQALLQLAEWEAQRQIREEAN